MFWLLADPTLIEAFTSDFGRHAQNTVAAAGGLAREPQTQRCRCAA
jgi:hypothetical protein